MFDDARLERLPPLEACREVLVEDVVGCSKKLLLVLVHQRGPPHDLVGSEQLNEVSVVVKFWCGGVVLLVVRWCGDGGVVWCGGVLWWC